MSYPAMLVKSLANNRAYFFLRHGLLIYVVVMFFCDIAVYLSLAVNPRLEPQYWLGLLILFVLILATVSPDYRFEVIRTPLFFWCLLFMVLTAIMFIAVPTSHFQQVKERVRDVALLLALLSAFLMMRDQFGFLRKLIMWAVLLGVAINLIILMHHNLHVSSWFVLSSRPAGFYINPNESATALVCGMIVSISILPQRWRILYAAFVFVGVLATFSREAILGWIVVIIVLCILGLLNWKKLIFWIAVLIVVAGIISFILMKLGAVNKYVVMFYHLEFQRLTWFVNGKFGDPSVNHRMNVLKAGWELFLEHPWIGNGIGSTEHWKLPVSTHNMYLYYMDDYGVLGLFLYPLLAWCVAYESVGETRKIAWCMAIFLLVWGLFDHDVGRNYYSLFSISLVAAMSRASMTGVVQRAGKIPAEA